MTLSTTFFASPYQFPDGTPGVGYTIIDLDGSLHIRQEVKPGVNGYVAMTQAEAEAALAADLQTLQPQ